MKKIIFIIILFINLLPYTTRQLINKYLSEKNSLRKGLYIELLKKKDFSKITNIIISSLKINKQYELYLPLVYSINNKFAIKFYDNYIKKNTDIAVKLLAANYFRIKNDDLFLNIKKYDKIYTANLLAYSEIHNEFDKFKNIYFKLIGNNNLLIERFITEKLKNKKQIFDIDFLKKTFDITTNFDYKSKVSLYILEKTNFNKGFMYCITNITELWDDQLKDLEYIARKTKLTKDQVYKLNIYFKKTLRKYEHKKNCNKKEYPLYFYFLSLSLENLNKHCNNKRMAYYFKNFLTKKYITASTGYISFGPITLDTRNPVFKNIKFLTNNSYYKFLFQASDNLADNLFFKIIIKNKTTTTKYFYCFDVLADMFVIKDTYNIKYYFDTSFLKYKNKIFSLNINKNLEYFKIYLSDDAGNTVGVIYDKSENKIKDLKISENYNSNTDIPIIPLYKDNYIRHTEIIRVYK